MWWLEVLMSVGWRKSWKCDLCGHYWLVVGGDSSKVPRQCPKCRKTQWHTKGDFTGGKVQVGDVVSKPAAGPWDACTFSLHQFIEKTGRRPESIAEWNVFYKYGRLPASL